MYVKMLALMCTGKPLHGGKRQMIRAQATGDLMVKPTVGKDGRTYLTATLEFCDRKYVRLWDVTLYEITTLAMKLRGYEMIDDHRYFQEWECEFMNSQGDGRATWNQIQQRVAMEGVLREAHRERVENFPAGQDID